MILIVLLVSHWCCIFLLGVGSLPSKKNKKRKLQIETGQDFFSYWIFFFFQFSLRILTNLLQIGKANSKKENKKN